MPAAYQDGRSVPRGGRHPSSLPNPRWISQKNHPDSDIPDPRYTHMVMQFGQFLDHDITLTPKDGKLYIRKLSLNFYYDAVKLCGFAYYQTQNNERNKNFLFAFYDVNVISIKNKVV